MTDEKRARAVVDKWLTIEGIAHITMGWSAKDGIEPIRQQFIDGLIAEFITARVEERAEALRRERASVVKFLNRLAASSPVMYGEECMRVAAVGLFLAAGRIDRGEHMEESK